MTRSHSHANDACGGLIRRVEDRVRTELSDEATGHDWHHAARVRRVAVTIAVAEGASLLSVELAALLHDVKDYKFSGSIDAGPTYAEELLLDYGATTETAATVRDIIANLSFKGLGSRDNVLSLEGQCVRDADRLDAIGAIGVARVFAYGGYVGRPLHEPDAVPAANQSPEEYRTTLGTSINHFHEKLLHVKDRLDTKTARDMAARRHQFIELFLTEFDLEWASADITQGALPSVDPRTTGFDAIPIRRQA